MYGPSIWQARPGEKSKPQEANSGRIKLVVADDKANKATKY